MSSLLTCPGILDLAKNERQRRRKALSCFLSLPPLFSSFSGKNAAKKTQGDDLLGCQDARQLSCCSLLEPFPSTSTYSRYKQQQQC